VRSRKRPAESLRRSASIPANFTGHRARILHQGLGAKRHAFDRLAALWRENHFEAPDGEALAGPDLGVAGFVVFRAVPGAARVCARTTVPSFLVYWRTWTGFAVPFVVACVAFGFGGGIEAPASRGAMERRIVISNLMVDPPIGPLRLPSMLPCSTDSQGFARCGRVERLGP
jgi:hypothetical protein